MTYILVHPTLFSVYPIFSPLPNRSCFPLSTIVIIMIGTTLHHHASAVSVQFRIITNSLHISYILCISTPLFWTNPHLPCVPIAVSLVDLPLIHFRLLRAMTIAAHIAASRPVAPWQDLPRCFAR